MADTTTTEAALGKALRQIREREGLTQEELATRAGFHLTWVSRVEAGTQNTGWVTAKRLADALDVTMVELAALVERIEFE